MFVERAAGWGKPEEDGGSAIDKYRVVAHKTKTRADPWMNLDFTQSRLEQSAIEVPLVRVCVELCASGT